MKKIGSIKGGGNLNKNIGYIYGQGSTILVYMGESIMPISGVYNEETLREWAHNNGYKTRFYR